MAVAMSSIEHRKSDHIRVNLDERVRAHDVSTGFERFRFVHSALPEIDLADVDLSQEFLGARLKTPLLISSMTGGVHEGFEINRRLARAAEDFGCAMGVGSQRAAIEDPALARFFRIRDEAPTIPIFANLGAVQLNLGYDVDDCRRVVEMIDANALILHLNPLQEALQIDGDRDYRHLLARIESVCRALEKPVIVKEVGWGISATVARRLVDAGVAAIDVSGAGGTSWSYVEGQRAADWVTRRICESFQSWGIPTLTSLRMVKQAAPAVPIIASGGLMTGIDAAKAIAFGADMVGFAGPLLRAAAASEAGAHELLSALIEELRISMFCTGSKNLHALRQAQLININVQLLHASDVGQGHGHGA
jgi:isopentenyl-diphosphate delta-isomerase